MSNYIRLGSGQMIRKEDAEKKSYTAWNSHPYTGWRHDGMSYSPTTQERYDLNKKYGY